MTYFTVESSTRERPLQLPQSLLLSGLPDEILVEILQGLPVKDILTFGTTARWARALIEASTLLQLIIELHVEGLKLNAFISPDRMYVPKGKSAVDRLKALRQAQSAWSSLTPIVRSDFDFSSGCFFLQGSLFAKSPFHGGLRSTTLQFRYLYNGSISGRQSEWDKCENVGFEITDFVFNQEEDLLVLMESRSLHFPSCDKIHLRTISSRIPHPRASYPTIQLQARKIWNQCDLKTVGPLLVCYFFHNGDWHYIHNRVCVWNWMTGDLLLDRVDASGYAILSPSIVLLVVRRTEYGAQDPPPQSSPFLDIELIEISDSPTTRAILALPFSRTPSNVIVSSEAPSIGQCSAASEDLLQNQSIDAFVPEETAQRVISLRYQGENTRHRIFISVHRVLRTSSSIAKETRLGSPYFTWDEWGPDCTFWLPLTHIHMSWLPVSGSRFCALVDPGEVTRPELEIMDQIGLREDITSDEEERIIFVLDFNSRPIYKSGAVSQATKEWTWDIGTDVNYPIVSRLPFRLFQGSQKASCNTAYLTPSHLLACVEDHYQLSHFLI
ncbi:hypothetical protein CPB86DRAFT_877367 [Serendipita vermifera]|nr:hypothetical protein CPB86DRAFT_877367 [Serendipita vermifera]